MEAEVPSPRVAVAVVGMHRAHSQTSQNGCRGAIDQSHYREMTKVRAMGVAMEESEGVDCLWDHHEIGHERVVILANDGMRTVEVLLAERHAATCIDQ
jgi:hypothetical protein